MEAKISNDAEEVIEYFEQHSSEIAGELTPSVSSSSITLEPDDDLEMIEWVRGFGVRAINETGYTITGVRFMDGALQLWFDELDQDNDGETENKYLTIAQKAASIIEEQTELSRVIPNISGDPQRQYVQLSETNIDEYVINELRENKIEIRSIGDDKIYFTSQ